MSKDKDLEWIEKSGGFEWTPGSPWPPKVEHSDYYYDYTRNDPDRKNPFTDPEDRERAFKVTGQKSYIYESPDKGQTVYRYESGTDPRKRELVEEPSLYKNKIRKYEEDISLKDLQEYVATTYEGHYTSDRSENIQTLDIIESVGDAKSFCRSNAIKYLTRYDKKGQAKRDILKAAHYCLLLYYFDGHTNTN